MNRIKVWTAVLFVICGGAVAWADDFDDGVIACNRKDYTAAVVAFSKAILANPDNVPAYVNRGNAYSYLGELDKAVADYNAALTKRAKLLGPDTAEVAPIYYNRAYAYQRAGKYKEAIADYQTTIRLDDTYQDAHGNYAWICGTAPAPEVHDQFKAVDLALMEVKIAETPSALDTLAAGYASRSDFDKAVETEEKALEKETDEALKSDYRSRLELYKQKKPYTSK